MRDFWGRAKTFRWIRWDGTAKTAAGGFAILFISLNIWGAILKARLGAGDRDLTVLAVQHNIGQLKNVKREKGFASLSDQVFFQLKEMTYKGPFAAYKIRRTAERRGA